MQFTRIISQKKIAIFFEGEDEKYYGIRINNIRPDIKWSGVNCGGKSKVIEVRNIIKENPDYVDSSCMFFIDADFDDNKDLIDCNDIYITPCYSVENLYTSKEAFIRILNAEFNLHDSLKDNSCFHNAIGIFDVTKAAYLDSIAEFNFLIRQIRIMECNGELSTRLNINNIKFDDLIKVDFGSSDKIYNEALPNSIFPELPSDLVVKTDDSKKYFSKLPGELWFRGKQNLEFFRVFLQLLKTDRCRKENHLVFKEKGNVRLQLSKLNCISELSQYADTPKCLHEFLSKQ